MKFIYKIHESDYTCTIYGYDNDELQIVLSGTYKSGEPTGNWNVVQMDSPSHFGWSSDYVKKYLSVFSK